MSGIAITFPSSPIEGQTYLAQNGFTYVYDSLKNRWNRGGDFVRAPKVLSFAGVAATTTGSGITTGPNGALIYNVPGFLIPSSDVGVDSYKAYRYSDSYPNYTEIQVSISSAFSTIAYAATSTSTTFSIPAGALSGDTTYYLRARQFVGSNASAASTGAISGYSQNIVSFATTSLFLDSPTIVSIAGSTRFPVYQIGFANTTLPATVTYTGSGVGNLQQVEWRVTGPRNPDSTGDTALAEVGIGTFSSATLANALVLAMPFSGATGVGITNDVNNAIRTASGASAGTTKTISIVGSASTVAVGVATTTAHYYPSAASFNGSTDYLSVASNNDFELGSGNFTIEWWEYITVNHQSGIVNRSGTTGVNGGPWVLLGRTSGNIEFYAHDGTGGTWNISNGSVIGTRDVRQWTHWAVVRSGSLFSAYKNGVRTTFNVTSSASFAASSSPLIIGNWDGTFNGYLQDLKIYKGIAKYQENFTPPLPTYGTISYTTRTIGSVGVATTAFFESTGDIPTAEVAIGSSTAAQVASSLVLAMPMNRTFGFQDINVAIRGLTSGASAGTAKTVGLGTTSTANAPTHPIISSTESKWYDGAAYFDGSDRVVINTSTDLDLTGDFTIEGWFYRSSGGSAYPPLWSTSASGSFSAETTIFFGVSASEQLDFYSDGVSIVTTSPISRNTWNHFSVTRNGSTTRIFLNGILQQSSTTAYTVRTGQSHYLGDRPPGAVSANYPFTGYLQDLKIYKGFAKYTANFTPPQPICGFTTDLAIQTGFTTTTATGSLLSSVVGLGSTSTLAFSSDLNLVGVTSITSSSGITTLPDPYAQNLVLALPLANITGVGNSFTNDRNTQIRTASITGAGVTAGTTKTITNTGVTTVSISTSKYYGNTASFNGTSSFLNITPRDNFTPTGNTPFTFEAWIYPTASTDGTIFGTYFNTGSTGAGGERGFLFYYNSSRTITVSMRESFSAGNVIPSTTTSIPLNTWTHLAIQIGAQTDIYFDGVLQPMSVSYFNSTSADGTRNPIVSYHASAVTYLGANIGTGTTTSFFNGYIQDAKIYNNFRKYTSNFTPPPPMFGDYTRSTPNKIVFTPGSDYALEARNTATGGIVTSTYSATRQWGTKPKGGIYDPYASNLVLAIPGGAVSAATSTYDVTGQIRYETPTASYVNAGIVTYSNSLGIGTYQNKTVTNNNTVSISSTITKYYSNSMRFLSGSTQTLTTPVVSGSANLGSDFTIELWAYKYSGSSYMRLVSGGNSGSHVWTIGFDTTWGSGLQFNWYDGTDYYSRDVSSMVNHYGNWYHIAVSRKGSILYYWLNGVNVGTSVVSATYTANEFVIGNRRGATEYWNGHMNDIRVYNGVAKYTSNFTPPNQIYLT